MEYEVDSVPFFGLKLQTALNLFRTLFERVKGGYSEKVMSIE